MGSGCSSDIPEVIESHISPLSYSPTPHMTYKYDVFISHKQIDCEDFARAIKESLYHKHNMTCFLDRDAPMGSLSSLQKTIKNSRNLIFIISPNVFNSQVNGEHGWCVKELMWALHYKTNIITVRYDQIEFAQYKKHFPTLPYKVQKYLQHSVAVPHTKDYYDSFISMVVSLIKYSRPSTRQSLKSHELDTIRHFSRYFSQSFPRTLCQSESKLPLRLTNNSPCLSPFLYKEF